MRISRNRMIKEIPVEKVRTHFTSLLASFAQIYKNQSVEDQASPNPLSGCLDRHFQNRSAESSKLYFSDPGTGISEEAIISATNDKIQNYLENVDPKTVCVYQIE